MESSVLGTIQIVPRKDTAAQRFYRYHKVRNALDRSDWELFSLKDAAL
jgi:hypothetical protein